MQQHSPTDPTGARPNDAVLFVALELSRASWLVAIQAPGRDKISRHDIDFWGKTLDLGAHDERDDA